MTVNSAINLYTIPNQTGFSISGGRTSGCELSILGGNPAISGGQPILNGQLLIGNGGDNSFTQGTIIAGSGMQITSGAGSLQFDVMTGILATNNQLNASGSLLQAGITNINNLTGLFLTGFNSGLYITNSELYNSGFLTGILPGANITVINNNNGSFTINSTASGGGGATYSGNYINFDFRNNITINSGINSQYIPFSANFGTIPLVISDIVNSGNPIISHCLSGISASGFNIILSNITNNSNYLLNYIATTGSGYSLLGGGPTTQPMITGRETIWIPAGAIVPTITSGSVLNQISLGIDIPDITSCDYAPGNITHSIFNVGMPKSWDCGSLYSSIFWSHTSGATGSVVWRVQGLGVSNNQTLSGVFTSGILSTGYSTNSDYQWKTPEFGPLIVSGANTGEIINFRVSRMVGDPGDTLGVSGRLMGVKLIYLTTGAID